MPAAPCDCLGEMNAVRLRADTARAGLRAWAEARAAGVDVIIDDTDPRWSYSGGGANNGGWTGGGSGDAASTEHLALDVKRKYQNRYGQWVN